VRFRSLVVTFVVFVVPAVLVAQERDKIYLDPDDTFSSYFSAALQKKKVPVTVTADPKQADFTAQFQAQDSNGSVLKGVLSQLGVGPYNPNDSKSFNEVTMTVVNTKTQDVVFSYTCSKQSQWADRSWALMTSVAECLAKHWGQNLH
jgi:hypothetical protein